MPARPPSAAVPRGLTLSLRRAWAQREGGEGRESDGAEGREEAHRGASWWVTRVTALLG